jgi:tetratricopeptide (TPR) repeat protein
MPKMTPQLAVRTVLASLILLAVGCRAKVITDQELTSRFFANWGPAQNNLGTALTDLAERSEGTQIAQYLQQAVEAYNSALQVKTESGSPEQWAQVVHNLAQTYEAQKDWGNAQKCYEQLVRHYPTDQTLQAKG